MQDDEKTAEKSAEPVKSIDHNAQAPSAAHTDVGSKAV
jgi:sec-independent protein translocase protein TatA